MPERSQSYANHRRWSVLHHFVAYPIAIVALVVALQLAWANPSRETLLLVILAVSASMSLLSARVMALTVQNRVIRLEMRLRLREALPAPLAERAKALKVRHLVALRFAGDAELPSLVERCLSGELDGTDAVKKAIRDWQPDFLRA